MKNDKFYIDFHVIQTLPPSCVNRDDTGRPKTAVYGGTTRARVSSQAWKHAMREMFAEIISNDNEGFRTKHAIDLIADELSGYGTGGDEAQSKAVSALENAGKKIKDKKTNTTGALFFISRAQAKALASLAAAGETEKKKYKAALNDTPSVDIALFGRMAADDPELNIDAACQVAHAISTHAVQNEFDYFTAVDDCSPSDNAGAGHLGTMEFNSATVYRYATVNVNELKRSLGADTADAVRVFAEAFIRSMPTGKQNSYANRTLPDAVYVSVRKDQPVNLCGAFEKPVDGRSGFADRSVLALFAQAEKIYDNYCGIPERSFIIGADPVSGAEKVDLNSLLDKLYVLTKEEVG